MKDPFCYSFRFCCDPYFNEARELESLKRFCREAEIDDVSVFCNVEELNTGHTTPDEQEIYLALLKNVRGAVAPQGVTVSVNPWHSLMHADLGKALRPDQPFRRMVDPAGREASLCVCPMDEAWQNHFVKLYARYAAFRPNILWVEDDFRLHNHDPLLWGGCFCPAHMAEYSRRAGKTLTREEFVRGVLAPGGVHPYRKIWLDVSRGTMTRLAERVGRAVHEVSPQTRVGLMSSVPYVHAAEGRDWHGILEGFAAGNPPVSRIHLPCYSEVAPQEYLMRFDMVSMACRALIPENSQVYPELENYPYSRFSKSRMFTRFQLASALPLDLAGMTIDLFDLNGSGIVFSDGYQDMLRECKPFLNAVTASGAMRQEKRGVRVLISERSSYTLETEKGERMEELYPQEVYFAGLLGAFGIPFVYETDPGVRGCCCAVSGQYLRNLSEGQIEALFADNFVLLSGDAAWTLFSLGLGRLAGIRSCRWMVQNGGEYAFEQVVPEKTCGEVPEGRASAVISSADALRVEYEGEPELWTRFYDSFRRPVCPGHAVWDGRALVYPFGRFSQPGEIPPMQLNPVRRDILQKALAGSGKLDAPIVLGAAHLHAYCTKRGQTVFLYLVNGSHDPAENLSLLLPDGTLQEVRCLSESGRESPVVFTQLGREAKLSASLPPLSAALLTLEFGKEQPHEG